MSFYCQDAFRLIEECLRTKGSKHIPVYREDAIKLCLLEIQHLIKSYKDTYRKKLHKICLERTKQCVLAYQRERMNRYIDLIWECGASKLKANIDTSTTLPEKDAQAASVQEGIFIKEYQELVTEWKGYWLDIDVGASIIDPPRDLFVEVRVIRNCGQVSALITR
jgi:GINS complex subunit 1